MKFYSSTNAINTTNHNTTTRNTMTRNIVRNTTVLNSKFRKYLEFLSYVSLFLSLSACSTMNWQDYKIKDSLFVWSDTSEMTDSSDQEAVTAMPEQEGETLAQNERVSSDPEEQEKRSDLGDLPHEQSQVTLIAETSATATPVIPLVTGIAEEAETEAESIAVTAPLPIAQDRPTIAEAKVESVEDVNRLTQATPTAAGTPVSKVLPKVNVEVDEADIPNEILLLAGPSDYQEKVQEFGMWRVVKADSSMHNEVCTLSSSTMQVDQYDYTTQVWFNVVGASLLVNSTTNIDVKRPQVGIKFDNASIQPFTKNYFGTSAVWSGDLNSVLKQNQVLNVSLSGNELGRKTLELGINLNDLKLAYSEYRKCNRGTQIGSL